MTQPTKHPAIPPDLLSAEKHLPFILWLASMNLPEADAYRTYKDWCDHTGRAIDRQDLDTLCGTDFNVS